MKNLRKLRIASGVKVSELAKEMGRSVRTIYYWQSGKTKPSKGESLRLAELLDRS